MDLIEWLFRRREVRILNASVETLKNDLNYRLAGIKDLNARLTRLQYEYNRMVDQACEDKRRFESSIASKSFLADELASQVAMQRKFAEASDKVIGVLVDSNPELAKKVVRRGKPDPNPGRGNRRGEAVSQRARGTQAARSTDAGGAGVDQGVPPAASSKGGTRERGGFDF